MLKMKHQVLLFVIFIIDIINICTSIQEFVYRWMGIMEKIYTNACARISMKYINKYEDWNLCWTLTMAVNMKNSRIYGLISERNS